jgi:hypothetical protein
LSRSNSPSALTKRGKEKNKFPSQVQTEDVSEKVSRDKSSSEENSS